MSIILQIDTAIDKAIISVAKNGELLHELTNTNQKEHGSFVHPAIENLLKITGLQLKDIDVIAVSAGPGSYTGLRVGMASAKGLSFALQKPLILIGTLEILATGAIMQMELEQQETTRLFCPMIDARRNEVFTAIYANSINTTLPTINSINTILQPCAMILNENSFANWLLKNKIYFFGNGANKWKIISTHFNAQFLDVKNNTLAMSKLAFKKFKSNDFTSNKNAEPLYVKEFYDDTLKR